jgi:VCBS repeat-containing protein
MTEGNPRLNVEAGLDGYEKAFVYNGSASLQRNGAWWYVVEPVEVTSMEDGYTVSATAKNMQSTDGEATDILIRVTCE